MKIQTVKPWQLKHVFWRGANEKLKAAPKGRYNGFFHIPVLTMEEYAKLKAKVLAYNFTVLG